MVEALVPHSSELSPKVLEQLTQRFQRYKKDVNATLIALYKDTKRLMQMQTGDFLKEEIEGKSDVASTTRTNVDERNPSTAII